MHGKRFEGASTERTSTNFVSSLARNPDQIVGLCDFAMAQMWRHKCGAKV
jgi:hypothetical protein